MFQKTNILNLIIQALTSLSPSLWLAAFLLTFIEEKSAEHVKISDGLVRSYTVTYTPLLPVSVIY